jgi:hypothetical protein
MVAFIKTPCMLQARRALFNLSAKNLKESLRFLKRRRDGDELFGKAARVSF